MILNIGSGQKYINFWLFREISIFLSTARMYMEINLYLPEIIFVTDVAVLNIDTIKLVFKPLDVF